MLWCASTCLKNLYGFEYLIAPYTIAHLKLSQYLKDKGHELADDERLQVYLTNTLEPVEPQKNMMLPELTHEVEAAQEVKDMPILVILGNPPYSGHSKNNGAWIKAAIDGYKYTVETVEVGTNEDGTPKLQEQQKPLGERNPKWLNDDYVKFIRFAQLKMDAVDEGVVGIITNHSWLDNPTFRGMRQSLMRSFDQIYVLDLHGNSKKKEKTPEGGKDVNVFDIEQGVAISLCVKKPGAEKGIWRGDLWGERLQKYQALADGSPKKLIGHALQPVSPHYLMLWQDAEALNLYNENWSLPEMIPAHSVGIVTARDKLTIHFTKDEVRKTIHDFASLPVEEARQKYGLGDDVRDWRVEWAQEDLKSSGLDDARIVPILYRPFDVRWTYYTGKSRGFHCYPRDEVMSQLSKQTLGLITSRLTKGENFAHTQIAEQIFEVICMSSKTSNNGFGFPVSDNGSENLSPEFRDYLDTRYRHHYSPEEILGYIYAVLHAPTYRRKYAEFLRIDFPRIPFAETNADFEALSNLGWELIEAHLMREMPKRGLGDYHGKGDNTVEQVRWSAEDQRISINRTQSFAPVPEAVWNFHIGGYQVIDKYLKSRKDRELSLDEITHVGRICDALAFTIDQMTKIDTAYTNAFPDS